MSALCDWKGDNPLYLGAMPFGSKGYERLCMCPKCGSHAYFDTTVISSQDRDSLAEENRVLRERISDACAAWEAGVENDRQNYQIIMDMLAILQPQEERDA